MSTIASDLTRHLSRELELLHGRHTKVASTVLPAAEVLTLMIETSVNLAVCAVGSYVATLAASAPADRPVCMRSMVDQVSRLHGDCLLMRADEVVELLAPRVAAARARA